MLFHHFFTRKDDENRLLEEKFLVSKIKSKSQFMRTMIFKGFVIKFDNKNLKNVSRNISGIASNINQIAIRVNSTGNIYAEDISEIQRDINELWRQLRLTTKEILIHTAKNISKYGNRYKVSAKPIEEYINRKMNHSII